MKLEAWERGTSHAPRIESSPQRRQPAFIHVCVYTSYFKLIPSIQHCCYARLHRSNRAYRLFGLEPRALRRCPSTQPIGPSGGLYQECLQSRPQSRWLHIQILDNNPPAASWQGSGLREKLGLFNILLSLITICTQLPSHFIQVPPPSSFNPNK